jgi:hypothetical protein
MATIKTTGTGSELRIITKTVEGQVLVSCECCVIGFCDSLPATVDVTFSGITRCSPSDSFPLPNGLYTLTLNEELGQFLYMSDDFSMYFNCSPNFGFQVGVQYIQGDYSYFPSVFLSGAMYEENVEYLSALDLDNCGEGEEPYIAYGGIVSYEFGE